MADTDYDRMIRERYNALALRCDELTKEVERLKANQMPPGAVCFVPTGEVRIATAGEWIQVGNGFVEIEQKSIGEFPIYRRVEAQGAATDS